MKKRYVTPTMQWEWVGLDRSIAQQNSGVLDLSNSVVDEVDTKGERETDAGESSPWSVGW